MAQSLEQYIAEATNAYRPAQTAIQTQLGALDSNLATAQDTINRNYAQQQKQLESQRNQAAEASSLAAAGSGGSFGGQANLARRKYYEQSFVPAQTQLQTNQANEIAKARQDYENQRTSLNAQMANLESQANQQALQQYWAQQEAERNRQAQLAAARAANAWNYIGNGGGGGQSQAQTPTYKNWDFGNGYALTESNGKAVYTKNGKQISAGNFLAGTGANGANWDLWKDVWNNGVSTDGVGSDTVAAFNYVSPTSSRYNYLF